MTKISLKAKARKTEDNLKDLRENNILPAVIYGPNSENTTLALDYKEFESAFKQAGESTLIDLIIDDKTPVKVLVHDIQKDPISDKYAHIDLYQLDMNKKIQVEVELVFEGLEEVEKATGGEIIKNMDKVQVECLPQDLVKEIEINVQDYLKELGDVMHLSSLKLPEGLTAVSEEDLPIISIQEIKEVVEETPVVEAESEEGAEGEEKKEGEESTEGETAPAEGEEKKEDK